MKRSPLIRRARLKSGAGLRRRTRLNPVNRERRKKLHARNFGERAVAVRAMHCLVAATVGVQADGFFYLPPMCLGGAQAAHAIARGMGGVKGDRRDLVPLCWIHHREAGERGTSERATFEQRHGIDLQAEAKRIAKALDECGLP